MRTWTGADPYEDHRRRVATVVLSLIAVAIVLLLVAAMVLTRPTAVESRNGVGDPYTPRAGGSGYDVQGYQLDLRVDPTSGRVEGTTIVTLTPTENLSVINLDLGLQVSSVRMGNETLTHIQSGYDLAVKAPPSRMLSSGFSAGRTVQLTVAYEGRPIDVLLDGEGSVYTQGTELLIAGEPQGAAAWFPSNDHPSDPATFAATIRVPNGFQAISVGRLVSHTTEGSDDVWRWQTDEPTVTYATTLAVGHFDVVVQPVLVGGVEKQAVYAVSHQVPNRERAMTWLQKSPQAADTLNRWLGPYPVSSTGGIVPAAKPWWGGLETLGRPIYHPGMVGNDSVIYHELAHMWFGDVVTLQRWDDLFINESLTTYAEWLAEEAQGRGTPQQRFDDMYRRAPDSFWRQKLSDPGPGKGLFTRVYDRGPMVVHATRIAMGDEAFFPFFKAWALQKGPRSLEQWREQAQRASSTDLGPLFDVWLDGTTKVPNRPEYGFR